MAGSVAAVDWAPVAITPLGERLDVELVDALNPSEDILFFALLQPGDEIVQTLGQRARLVVVDGMLATSIADESDRRDDRGGTRTKAFLQRT